MVDSSVNHSPFFQSGGNLSVPENTTFIFEFNATDPDGDALTYSIPHEDDQTLFEINATTGALSFILPKDFESPEDNNSDNIYELTVQVFDGSMAVPLNVYIQVTDDPMEPDFDTFGILQIEENRPAGSFIAQFTPSNLEPGLSFSYSVLSFEEDPAQIEDRILELEALSQDPLKSQQDIDAYQAEIMDLQERKELVKSKGLFYVDQNGSLRTSQMLDFEAFNFHPYLPIMVQAVNEHNYSITKHFVVEVMDVAMEPDFDTFGILQIEENRPAGSFIAQFTPSNLEPGLSFSYSVLSFEEDPAQIEDRILELEALSQDPLKSQQDIDAYQAEIMDLQERKELVKSKGLFYVDQNGSLRTSQMLDFEAFNFHPYLPIMVQAVNEHNYSITKHFVVEVMDREFEPEIPLPAILRTLDPIEHNESGFTLQAKILADGGSYIYETGFIVSKSIRFYDSVRVVALIDPISGYFSADFLNFEPGTRYYYRSYAFNNFGESKGSIKKFKTPEIIDPSIWWKDMPAVGGGWRNSEWFGSFLTYPNLDWVYHSNLGWIYVVPDQNAGIWIWHSENGWLWTQEGVWPYLYSDRTANWIYFMKKISGQAIFYDYETRQYNVSPGF